jgi:hypothetical protein
MQAIIWWTVPLVAFVLAIVWVSIANRERPPVDPHDSVAEHERFREAMERQVGQPPLGQETIPGQDDPSDDGPERPAGGSRGKT